MKKIIAMLLCLALLGCCAAVAETAETGSKSVLGTVGEYTIKYKPLEGYKVTIINSASTSLVAMLNSETADTLSITLSIAFNDSYFENGRGLRLNEVSEEDIALIKESFEEETEVESFADGETSLGTKVLIVRGTIAGTNYADVYSIYNAYEVEALITPGIGAADMTLTDEHVQMVIDFFSEMEFV